MGVKRAKKKLKEKRAPKNVILYVRANMFCMFMQTYVRVNIRFKKMGGKDVFTMLEVDVSYVHANIFFTYVHANIQNMFARRYEICSRKHDLKKTSCEHNKYVCTNI